MKIFFNGRFKKAMWNGKRLTYSMIFDNTPNKFITADSKQFITADNKRLIVKGA